MNQLITAISNRLKENAMLVAEVGDRISVRRGKTKDFPYITINIIDNEINMRYI